MSGLKLTARFCGIVQGVVVQMTTWASEARDRDQVPMRLVAIADHATDTLAPPETSP